MRTPEVEQTVTLLILWFKNLEG